ncbi:putative RNA-directed DNA polymerase [Helianthus annuus]|nr:putative RNA-directed DNA polymerase [Helianthus annuus]
MAVQNDGGVDPGNGGPWQDVQYRKNNKSKGDGVEWTFLVQNLSDKVTRNILWRAFQPFGFVSDVYVARKRDSRGRCFGFVRYVGVVNMQETLASMNTIRMFNMKVTVSLAKYDKEHKKINYSSDILGRNVWRPKEYNRVNGNDAERNVAGGQNPGGYKSSHNQPSDLGSSGNNPVREGMSYADLFKSKGSDGGHGAKVVKVDGKGSLYPLHCIGRSVLGYTKEVMTPKMVKLALDGEGLSDVGLSYVGGKTYLFTFKDRKSANLCMELHSPFLDMMLSKYSLWNGEDIPFTRITKLNITGVPVLIRDNKLFDDIGALFGEVIQPSTFSWQEEDVSVGSVKVLTSQISRIDEAAVIKWNQKSLVIWVSEVPAPSYTEPDTGPSWSSDESGSELESDSEDESEGIDDLEEGEINQNMGPGDQMQEDMQTPVTEVDPSNPVPVGNENVSEVKESQEVQKLDDINVGEKAAGVHGEDNMAARDLRHKRDVGGKVNDLSCNGDGGLHINFSGREQVGLGIGSPSVGPTPLVNLGKRNRIDQSPPSIGSVQGPTQKMFYHPNSPLDLNTPASENLVSGEADADSHKSRGGANTDAGPGLRDRENFPSQDPRQEVVAPNPICFEEVLATFQVGSLIGVDLKGFESATEQCIVDEGETKVQDSEAFVFSQFWGRAEYKIATVNSQGRSGGLACLWCPAVFRCDNLIHNRYFIVVSGNMVRSGCRVNLINVYAPNDAANRRAVWSEILGIRNSLQGLWILMGDFNEVRNANERMNSEFSESSAEAFNQFILSAGLVEYNMGGGSFTYISDNGRKLSKLDRFLVCLGFMENWPNASVTALDREASDHRPIVLTVSQSDFGHTPFRFFNSWFEIPDFTTYVLDRCGNFSFSGPGDLALAIKLRWLKNNIKVWLKEEKHRREGIYGNKKKRLAFIESLAEERALLDEELNERMECKSFVADFDRLKQLDIRQKSRSRWAIDGDENSAFFHQIINSNISSNRLNGLMTNGEWTTNPLAIKESLFDFFRLQFTEPMPVRPNLVCPNLTSITDSDADMLVSPFSEEEIKVAVWDCEGDRAPGPDGFNFKFIKRCWSGLRLDIIKLFDKFFMEGSLNKCCTSSFIALIPKSKDPTGPADFRPISLIGVINKVISKVLVNRLKGVMGKLISEHQSAFLAGRSITDGPLILNEVLNWLKASKRSGMFFKVDISKAYDSVNWAFLNSIMTQMNFPSKWRGWVMATLYSARASVLVNGSPTREFDCSRGLRQGDPLSPFLFVIVMEALTGIMKHATSLGLFSGIKIPNGGPSLSHLMYADDVMFMGEWSSSNVNNLRRVMRCFYLASGLKINLAKCSIYGIGVNDQEVQDMASIINCKQGTFPFKHLGLVVGANMNLTRNWKSVVDIFKHRLSLWKAKTLSYGGRITLIKSVLNSLPTYYFSLFKAPLKVIESLDKIRRVFFWGGSEEKAKMNWVAWDKTIAPVEYGGLGFGSLRDANLAMLAKWWWRFKTEKDALWRQVVWAIHHRPRAWSEFPGKVSIAGPWKNILSIWQPLSLVGVDMKQDISATVRNGKSISFWLDRWADPSPLYLKFPDIFKIESDKNCSVADRLGSGQAGPALNWAWIRSDLSGVEAEQLHQLTGLLNGYVLESGPDRWAWKYETSGFFSVSSIKSWLGSFNRSVPQHIFKWNSWVPKKVAIVAWRGEMERLPTRQALSARNVPVLDQRCVMCGEYIETCEHLFVSCQFAQIIWQNVADWCKIPPIYAFGLKDLLVLHESVSGSRMKRKALHAVVLVSIWCLWKARNELVFRQTNPNTIKLLEEIKAMAFLWVKNRAKLEAFSWEAWSRFYFG